MVSFFFHSHTRTISAYGFAVVFETVDFVFVVVALDEWRRWWWQPNRLLPNPELASSPPNGIIPRLKPLPPFYAQNIILIVEKHSFNSKQLKAKLSLTLLLLLGRLFPNGSPTRFPNPLPNECWPNGCRLCPPLKLLNPLILSLTNHFIHLILNSN